MGAIEESGLEIFGKRSDAGPQEKWTTERVLRRLLPEIAAVEWVDPSAKVSLVERSAARAWAGHRLLDIEGPGVRLVAVSRLGSSMLPHDQLVAQEGDVVYLAVANDALSDLDARTAAPAAGQGH